MSLIDQILEEWSYRVHNGMPNPKNPLHLVQLEETLEELSLPREASEILLNNLRQIKEDDLVKNKKSGNVYGVKKHNAKTQDLVKKNASDAEIAAVADDEADDMKSTDAQTSRDDEDRKDTEKARAEHGETFTEDLDISDDEFAEKNKDNQTKTTYKLPDSIINNPKIPKKYVDLLERVLNTNKNTVGGTGKAEYYAGEKEGQVGKGNLESGMGEIMTLMATTLDREEREEFLGSIENHLNQVKSDGQETHVTKKWTKAARENSSAILRLMYDKHGKDFEIVSGAWDVEGDVNDMATGHEVDGEQYEHGKNKGFSTDIFFKIKTKDGTEVPEISLKQALQSNLFNSTVGATFKGMDLPNDIKPETYRKNQAANNDTFYETNQENVKSWIDGVDLDSPDWDKPDGRYYKVALDMAAGKTGVADVIIHNQKQMISQTRKDLEENPDLEFNREYVGGPTQVGKGKTTGDHSKTLKPMIAMSRLMGADGDPMAEDFVDWQSESGKEYARGVVEHIKNDPNAKKLVLESVQENLPLKSVSEGDEDIILGEYALTDKVLEDIFGTSDWNNISEGLSVDTESDPPVINYVGKVEGQDKVIPISTIGIREDGTGYRGGHKFEMKLNPQFGKMLKDSSNKIYPDKGEL